MPADRARSRSAHHARAPDGQRLTVFTPRRRGSGGGFHARSGERQAPSGGSGPPSSAAGGHTRLVTPPAEPLEPRTRKFLVRLGNDTSNHLIRDSLEQDEPGSVLWKPFAVVRGVDVLRGVEREHSESDAACLRGAIDVTASIEEFALLFKLDSHGAAALGSSGGSSGSGGSGGAASSGNGHGLLFDADLEDMVTVYPIVLPSGDHPRRFVGIKWCLVGAPSRLFRRRDFCFLECQKEFTDSRGRRGWVRSMHSVKLPTVPSLEKSHGIVRASLYRSGLTVVETHRPGVLRVTYTVEMDLKGRLPDRLLPNLIAQRISRLADIDRFLQTQRLSSSPLLGDLDLAEGLDITNEREAEAGSGRHRRAACQLCYKPFSGGGVFGKRRSKRYACRKCGESVCGNCSDDWLLDVPVIGQTMVRICTVCSAEAKHSHTVNAAAAVTADLTPTHIEVAEEEERTEEARALNQRMYRDQRASHRVMTALERPSSRDTRPRRRSLSMDHSTFGAMADEHNLMFEQDTRHSQQTTQALNAAQRRRNAQMQAEKELREQELRFDRAQFERVKWHGPAQRQTIIDDDDDDDEEDNDDRFDGRRPGDSIDRPSFMSSDRDPNSLAAAPEFFGAIATPSAPDEASDVSDDQEELTIDGSGEIRATADLMRWWTDESRQPNSRPHSGGGIVNGKRRNVINEQNVIARREERATWHNDTPAPAMGAAPARAQAAFRPSAVVNGRGRARPQSARTVITQEHMDLMSHYQRQSAIVNSTITTGGARRPYQQQQPYSHDPYGTYNNPSEQEEVDDDDDNEVSIPPPPQHQERMTELQRIREHQQRQQELRQRQATLKQQQQQQQQQQQPNAHQRVFDRPQLNTSESEYRPGYASVLAASSSSVATSSSLSSMGSSSSGQASGVANFALPPSSVVVSDANGVNRDSHRSLASSSSTNRSDQTAGESEYIETASGNWVSRRGGSTTPPRSTPAVVQERSGEPGFCTRCGSPEYLGDRGDIKRSCNCGSDVASSSKRTIHLEGRVLANGSDKPVQVAVDVEQVLPLIVERLSQSSMLPPQGGR